MNKFSTKLNLLENKASAAYVDPLVKVAEKVCKIYPEANITNKERKALVALQKDYDAAWRAGNVLFTEEQAKRAHREQELAHGKKARGEEIAGIRTRSLDSLVGEYLSKQMAGKAEMPRITAEADKIARPFIERFTTAAFQYIATREASEKAEAGELGLAYQPNVVIVALKALVLRLKARLAQNANGGSIAPRDMVIFVNLDN